MMLCLPWLTVAAQPSVKQQLSAQVTEELTQYLQFLGQPSNRSQIQVVLPKGGQQAKCKALTISRRNSAAPPLGRLSYQLACQAPQSWQARAIVHSHLWLDIVVAARTLTRGETLAEPLMALQNREVSKLNGQFSLDKEALLGYKIKRKVKAGQPLQRHYLQARYTVEKGDEVTLIVSGSLFSASAKGIVLKAGRKGEKVPVRNKSSGKVLRGTIVSSQQIEIFVR